MVDAGNANNVNIKQKRSIGFSHLVDFDEINYRIKQINKIFEIKRYTESLTGI